MPIPTRPKIYHIVHIDRLPSILEEGNLLCDAVMAKRPVEGSSIGMSQIKRRRRELTLSSHSGLKVGDCVPFYFCPRSIMLYVIHRQNYTELTYRGGQEPIIHLEGDLHKTVAWAEQSGLRWAFTLSNAGALYFEDRKHLAHLHEIDWEAVQSRDWVHHKEGKQAEFLVEHRFPWPLVSRIGVASPAIRNQLLDHLSRARHRPSVEVIPGWYY